MNVKIVINPSAWLARREEQTLAGAGGFEPPYGGIKIRCLTTWLRPNDRRRLPTKALSGNKTAGGAPPVGLGRGQHHERFFGRAAIGK